MGSLASLILLLLCVIALPAQDPPKVPVTGEEGGELPPFYCPMDLDVRSYAGGKCYKCSMEMVLGIPEPVEYRLKLSVQPTQIRPGEPVELQFEVLEPDHDHRVTGFQIVHERIFHLLFVHHELEIFRHEHPVLGGDGIFRHKTEFPKAGIYRMLADFYPAGSTPQLIPMTLTTGGFEQSLVAAKPLLLPDLEAKQGDNLTITLTLDPPEPIAGQKTLLFFGLDTAQGLEKFLGAWAHMLAVSDDLVDTIHAHPTIADGGPQIQLNMIFPRPGMYRIWIQTQREGRVNTIPFTVPVKELR